MHAAIPARTPSRAGAAILAPAAILALALSAFTAGADTPCPGFSWDVGSEHALFMTAPSSLSAGADRHSAPLLEPGRLVQLELKPVANVSFAAPPARAPAAGTYGGLARFQVPRTGSYRISVNRNVWIDVVELGHLIPAVDYEGSRSCDAPHKVVVFPLRAGRTLVLQVSGAVTAEARITLTPAP